MVYITCGRAGSPATESHSATFHTPAHAAGAWGAQIHHLHRCKCSAAATRTLPNILFRNIQYVLYISILNQAHGLTCQISSLQPHVPRARDASPRRMDSQDSPRYRFAYDGTHCKGDHVAYMHTYAYALRQGEASKFVTHGNVTCSSS